MGQTAGDRPNIIMIICHDLGRRLGCYGVSSVNTPNLDALAQSGVRFDRAFCVCPSCSPSRSAIVTGLYPHQNGMMGLQHKGWSLNAPQRCLPRLLAQNGYETLLFGLQHEVSRNGDACRVLGYSQAWEGSTNCHDVAERVVDWLRNERDPAAKTPFFASVGFFQPHRPHNAGAFSAAKLSRVVVPAYLPDLPEVRRELVCYEDLIEQVDACVGRIAAELNASDRWRNTLVIFTTDHGASYPRAKMSLYDPGIETALIASWIGVPACTGARDALISNVDLYPTLLEAAGVTPPVNEGVSFLASLRDPCAPRRDAVFAQRSWHGNYDPIRAIRTDRHKLIWNLKPGTPLTVPVEFIENIGRENVERTFAVRRPEFELYDLEADPDEFRNFVDDATMAETARDLRQRLVDMMVRTGDPALEGDIAHPAVPKPPVWEWGRTVDGFRLFHHGRASPP